MAGGLAVVAHGYVRFTADVDLIVDLDPANVIGAVASLEGLGYRPRAPVAFAEFADPKKRAQWVREKNLTVFCLYGPQHALTEIDLFVEPPLDFETAYRDTETRDEKRPRAHRVGAGWGGHETQQLERLSRMPLAEKLRWLEEAHHLVLHLSGAAPAPAPRAPDDRRVT